MTQTTRRFAIPVKIATAAFAILVVDAVLLLIFGDRTWRGLETLTTAAILTPLSALSWPLLETGGYAMLFGIDYARQAIWERRQKAAEKAQKDLEKAREEGRKEGLDEGRQEGIDQGYKLGYEAGVSDERLRRNGNGHDWMFGGPDDYR